MPAGQTPVLVKTMVLLPIVGILGLARSGPLEGEQLVPELAIDSFWFDWAAFHPETRIYARG